MLVKWLIYVHLFVHFFMSVNIIIESKMVTYNCLNGGKDSDGEIPV